MLKKKNFRIVFKCKNVFQNILKAQSAYKHDISIY